MYERIVQGEPLEFGVSGELYNSDLLMYDRKTDSRWDQINGVCVIGELTGERLPFYPSQMMTWGDWKQAYPESEVLSRITGHQRDYDGEPYRAYFGSDEIWHDVANVDTRLTAKTPVIGVEVGNDVFAAYVEERIPEHNPINDEIDGHPLLVVSDPNRGDAISVYLRIVKGRVLTFERDSAWLKDRETNSRWSYDGLAIEGELAGVQLEHARWLSVFWFAWVAFHPSTKVWRPGD